MRNSKKISNFVSSKLGHTNLVTIKVNKQQFSILNIHLN
jgi:hypothetical protein